ncbi:hypothetical protein GCM10028772_02920 [Nocardioides ultimimeridianus]
MTGRSWGTGRPFDGGSVPSDFDIALASPSLLRRASELGIGLRSSGTRTGPLLEGDLQNLNLSNLQVILSGAAGRDVNFMIYGSDLSAVNRAPSVRMP